MIEDLLQELFTLHGIFATLISIVFGYMAWVRISKPSNSPPMVEGMIPWVGVVPQFASSPVQYMTGLWQRFGEIFTVRLAGRRVTMLVGYEAHLPFFKCEDEIVDQNEPYAFSVPIFGPNVVYDVPPKLRYQQLKFLRKSLSLSQLNYYVPLVIDECEQFFATEWGNEGQVCLRDALSKLIILTASRCLMGQEIREHLSGEVAQIFQELDEGLLPISVFFPYLPIPAHRKRDAARLRMVALFSKVMKERRAHPEEDHPDVLQLFMNAAYKTDNGDRFLTDSEVAGLMIALLFAGQHTSSITSSWTGLCLLDNPVHLQNVLRENREVLEQCDGKLTYSALNKMDYLKRAIKEALRMFPPLIFVMRKALADIPVKTSKSDYVIPAGDYIFVSPSISHRDPVTYSNPHQYNPDRFAPDRDETKDKPFSYIGFGGGRHSCMGESFAYLQIQTIWSVLFRDFDLEPVGPLPEVDYTAMVVGPQQSMIRYRRKVPK